MRIFIEETTLRAGEWEPFRCSKYLAHPVMWFALFFPNHKRLASTLLCLKNELVDFSARWRDFQRVCAQTGGSGTTHGRTICHPPQEVLGSVHLYKRLLWTGSTRSDTGTADIVRRTIKEIGLVETAKQHQTKGPSHNGTRQSCATGRTLESRICRVFLQFPLLCFAP